MSSILFEVVVEMRFGFYVHTFDIIDFFISFIFHELMQFWEKIMHGRSDGHVFPSFYLATFSRLAKIYIYSKIRHAHYTTGESFFF